MSAVIAFTGCAGKVQKPHIYTPAEANMLRGISAQYTKATGVQEYCGSGITVRVQELQRQAYANIAEACGGEDKYSIIGELTGAPAYTLALGFVETSCPGLGGRSIYFKCNGAKPTPTGYTK